MSTTKIAHSRMPLQINVIVEINLLIISRQQFTPEEAGELPYQKYMMFKSI
jgi:hypothetical protein